MRKYWIFHSNTNNLHQSPVKKRQAEGIRLAKARGVHMGRPKYKLPNNFNKVSLKYLNNQISLEESLRKTNMKKSTFLKYYSKFKTNN